MKLSPRNLWLETASSNSESIVGLILLRYNNNVFSILLQTLRIIQFKKNNNQVRNTAPARMVKTSVKVLLILEL